MTVSVKDVAARAGVSVGTVSNVLNRPEKVNETTARRVHDAIADLGFVRNDAARQLREGRSRSIGLVVLDVANPFFTDLARGAENRAAENGLSVLLGNSDENDEREKAYLELFEEQRVHGVLISPRGEVDESFERIRRRGTPIVLVDRDGTEHGLSSVALDDVAGGYLAVSHLIASGRRRIAFVGGPVSIRQVSDRLAGARKAAAEHPEVTLDIILADSLSVLAGRAVGEELRERPEGDRPDAVFAANDLLAIGILQALVMLGHVRVPEDIALIGYDDISFSATAVIPLSSVRQPSELIGYTAVDLLMREAEQRGDYAPEHVVFQPELVVRASTVSPEGGREGAAAAEALPAAH
ncbi:LacI family DNA-binding transcriptional regulator [Klugiella xanthotipulae]|uniref:LacI family transcriptional regulator n=1 Tax=Klugiella xanthotipulae TaxID=244735 RepID=A0A543HGZ7_9MICO|nr:LacI family DNA-binding transcriptional regulator [Klugiella xanthotipulae]TQM57608.1 LacI family transcriptional regulator [Klugiella xanthotipulae]